MGLKFLWTNSLLADISADLTDIRARHIDVLFSYQMNQGPTTGRCPHPASDAQMTAYLNALNAAGLQTMLDVMFLGKYVVSSRPSKPLTSGELAALTAYVNKWKSHPAVWGWYADDEGGAEYPVATRQQVYDTIKAAHPAGQVFETHYHLVSGVYSSTVHDVFAADVGYIYQYDFADSGCISASTGLVTRPGNVVNALAGFKWNLDRLKTALDAAGETNYLVCMQAFKHGLGAASYVYAMPPVGGLSWAWDKVRAAGWDSYGAGWFLWKSDDDATLPGEVLDGVGEASYAAQRDELAYIATLPVDFDPGLFGVLDLSIGAGVDLAPRAPVYSVLIGAAGAEPSEDITDLVDLDTLHRSLSERGEASATVDIPVANENDMVSNLLKRDATVAIDVEGGREWLGHVVAVHKPKPQDLAWTLDCAGGWDTLHHCAPWCKGFVETRYDAVTEYPSSLYGPVSGGAFKVMTALDVNTDGQIQWTLPKGSKVKLNQARFAYLWPLDGMAPGLVIERVTGTLLCGGSGTLALSIEVAEEGPFSAVDTAVVASALSSAAYSAAFDVTDFAPLTAPTHLRLWAAVTADVAETSGEEFVQLTSLRIYIDRTTAPRVDEIVAAIDAEVRPGAPDPATGAIGAPLTAFMCDPFMTPADGIATALTKAAVPPLCGIFQNRLVIQNRPTAPPDAKRLWTVSEQLTPGLEWGVEIDEEQSVDYVGVSYASLGGNLIPVMTSATAPSGVATAGSELDANRAAWMAFDHANPSGAASGTWLSAAAVGWLQYQFPAAHVVTAYAVTSRNATPTPRPPKTWTFKGGNDGTTWVTLDTQTNITDWATTPNVRKVFNFANTVAYAYYRLDIAAGNDASYVGVGELEMMDSSVPDGAPRIAYYPSAPPNAAARSALIDGGDLTATEAAFYAQQGYHYLHDFASGPVTIPYVVRDANGAERPADVIRAWDWVQNVGSLDAATAGPFLVSEVEHQGHIATLVVGAAEAYAYNGPDRMPTKGRYVGAHRVRTKFKKRVSFAEYWKWKHRKDKRKPKMPRRHARYGTIRGWKWQDVEGRYT